MPTGAKFRYLCTSAGRYGWISDRKGYRYEEKHPVTQSAFPPMPAIIERIAVETSAKYGLTLRPESALINWYDEDGSLGLHQDKTEKCLAPVISISLGDDCVFVDRRCRAERSENGRDFAFRRCADYGSGTPARVSRC